MAKYYTKDGNCILCDIKPADGYTVEEWMSMHPPVMPDISLAEARAFKRSAINAGFDAAITASLTMPSTSTPASAFAVYQAIEAWKVDDPEGYATLLAIHTARRDALLAAVEAAQTAEAVLAIVVSYAV